MIGQKRFIEYLDNIINNFPGFTILVGPRGSGKRMLSRLIAVKLGANYSECGIKVDEVREMIDTAYKAQEKIVYCIADADNMRNEAKNALLKVTEEPPKNAYFVLTVEDDSTLLDTIKSRGRLFYMAPYSEEELIAYYNSKKFTSYIDVNLIAEIAYCPYDVDMLVKYGKEFIDFVELVLNNIDKVQPSNAFKSATKLALKSEDDKYDLKLFFSTFMALCIKKLEQSDISDEEEAKYSSGIIVTSPFAGKCCKLGVNKAQLYDEWVLDIRKAWLQ